MLVGGRHGGLVLYHIVLEDGRFLGEKMGSIPHETARYSGVEEELVFIMSGTGSPYFLEGPRTLFVCIIASASRGGNVRGYEH